MENHQDHTKSSLAALSLAAIGIVYGDIGTSPLYTMQEVFSPEHGLELNEFNIFGVVSLICWGLIIIVALKYVTLILRADNRGEGGIMALTALALESVGKSSKLHLTLFVLGLFGAALFYGDGVITPAVSVLSAIEGLKVATPAFDPYVVPITVVVIIALYAVQYKGTAGIGNWFGPIMLIWFIALATMGVYNIAKNPAIAGALNPIHAFRFMQVHGWIAFLALGAAFSFFAFFSSTGATTTSGAGAEAAGTGNSSLPAGELSTAHPCPPWAVTLQAGELAEASEAAAVAARIPAATPSHSSGERSRLDSARAA